MNYDDFIPRDFDRSENDDFELNVVDRLDEYSLAEPIYCDTFDPPALIGWRVVSHYE
jgi:hypothetical protein